MRLIVPVKRNEALVVCTKEVHPLQPSRQGLVGQAALVRLLARQAAAEYLAALQDDADRA